MTSVRGRVLIVEQYTCPDHMSTELQLLLNGLLQTDLTCRLGCLRSGVSDVKQHVWFNDIDWINIYYKKVCLAVPRALLPPTSAAGNAFGRVCLSVLFVLQHFKALTWKLHFRYTGTS